MINKKINVYRMTLETENAGIDHCLLVARYQLTRKITDAVKSGLTAYVKEMAERKGMNLTAMEKDKCYARTQSTDRVDWLEESDRVRRYVMFGKWEDRPARPRYEPMTLEEIDATIEKIENQLTAKGMA